MANGQEHKIFGTVAGVGGALSLIGSHSIDAPDQKLALLLGGVLGGQLGGYLPDMLEPADHPRHRSHCHSVAAGRVVWGAAVGAEAIILPLIRGARSRRSGRESLPRDHQDRVRLWIQEMLLLVSAGLILAAPLGYWSHLGADAVTPDSLPLL